MPPLGSLATFGYAAKNTLREIGWAMRSNPQALVIDTRLSPWCQWSHVWRRASLEIAWERRYIWRGDWLGNVNHHDSTLPIQLANEEAGIAWLVRGLEKGYTLILLCACANYDHCHRKVIVNRVRARCGARLPDYQPGQRVWTPDGAGVINPMIPLDVQRARNRYTVLLDSGYPSRYYVPSDLHPYDVTQHPLAFR